MIIKNNINKLLLIIAFFMGIIISPIQNASSMENSRANYSVSLSAGDFLFIDCPTSLTGTNRIDSDTWRIRCRPSSNTPTPSRTPTLVPPSATSVFTNTPHAHVTGTSTPIMLASPTNTRTPSGNVIQPYKNAPECTEHNATEWHGLWNYEVGCHYNHTHGDDPSLADAYFGKTGSMWGGQELSYPFATSYLENTMKHAGYKYLVKTPNHNPFAPCGTNDEADNSQFGNNCIKAARIQLHAVASLMDTMSRYHSYYMEIYACKYPEYTQCGTMKIGGWADFAQLQAPFYNDRIVRQAGTIDFGDGHVMQFTADEPDLPATSGEPYVFMHSYSPEYVQHLMTYPDLLQAGEQWSMNDLDCEPRPAGHPCHNQYARWLLRTVDGWNLVNKQNPMEPFFLCRDGSCVYNGSRMGIQEVAVRVLQSWQPNGNGFVTLTGYTDRWGNPRFDGVCSSVSVDCVPLVLNNMPVNYSVSEHFVGLVSYEEGIREYDIYFDGKPSGWIKFPN